MKNIFNLENTVNSVTYLNQDLTFRWGNLSFFESIGKKVSEIQNIPILEIIPHDWCKHIQPLLAPALEGHAAQISWQSPFLDTFISYKTVFVAPQYSIDQRIDGILISVFELTEQLSIHQQLEKYLRILKIISWQLMHILLLQSQIIVG